MTSKEIKRDAESKMKKAIEAVSREFSEVRTGRDVRDRFERIMGLALLMLRENRDLARIFLLEGVSREPGFEDKVRLFYERLITGAAANLKLWMDRGLLRPADPLTIAHCVVGMIERLTLQWAAGTIEGDFEAMVAEVVKFELYGILKDPAAAFADDGEGG